MAGHGKQGKVVIMDGRFKGTVYSCKVHLAAQGKIMLLWAGMDIFLMRCVFEHIAGNPAIDSFLFRYGMAVLSYIAYTAVGGQIITALQIVTKQGSGKSRAVTILHSGTVKGIAALQAGHKGGRRKES